MAGIGGGAPAMAANASSPITNAQVSQLMGSLMSSLGTQGQGATAGTSGMAGLDLSKISAMLQKILPPQLYAQLAPLLEQMAQMMQLMAQQQNQLPMADATGGGAAGSDGGGHGGGGAPPVSVAPPVAAGAASNVPAADAANAAPESSAASSGSAVDAQGNLTAGHTYADAQVETGSPANTASNDSGAVTDAHVQSVQNDLRQQQYNNLAEQAPLIMKVAQEMGLDPYLGLAVVRSENSAAKPGDPGPVGGAGEVGPGQIMAMNTDSWAKAVEAKGYPRPAGVADPRTDYEFNLRMSFNSLAGYVKSSGGDVTKALTAYNWGPGNVARKGVENAPASTKGYVKRITEGANSLKANANAAAGQAIAAAPPSGNTDPKTPTSSGDYPAPAQGGTGGGAPEKSTTTTTVNDDKSRDRGSGPPPAANKGRETERPTQDKPSDKPPGKPAIDVKKKIG
jgi:soluble lytic murein transglycosylase-like protein